MRRPVESRLPILAVEGLGVGGGTGRTPGVAATFHASAKGGKKVKKKKKKKESNKFKDEKSEGKSAIIIIGKELCAVKE